MGLFDNTEKAIDHVVTCMQKARKDESNLNADLPVAKNILAMFGMSGKKWRHFLNNLLSIEDVNYLEIGAHSGSTFCSALYGNEKIGFFQTIDNWSQFGNKKEELEQNVKYTLLESKIDPSKVKITESDFYKFDYSTLPKIDIYLFDGPHKEHFQYDGVKIVFDQLSDIFILLVDDWNWGGPKRGTSAVLQDLNVNVIRQWEIYTDPEGYYLQQGDSQPRFNRFQNSDWHNGVAVFVCEKTNSQ
tara:strand:- start:765 stop:1496 length:732 start_codon:yes stop_codon:yes gene_type:complete